MSDLSYYLSSLTGGEIDAAVLAILTKYVATFNGRKGPFIKPEAGDYDASIVSNKNLVIPEGLKDLDFGNSVLVTLNEILTCTNNIYSLLNKINTRLSTIVHTKVHLQQTSYASLSITNDFIKFNTVDSDSLNCWDAASFAFKCPYKGVYLVNFWTYSSNNSSESRVGLIKNGAISDIYNTIYGRSCCWIVSCEVGDLLQIGSPSEATLWFWNQGPYNGATFTLLSTIPDLS